MAYMFYVIHYYALIECMVAYHLKDSITYVKRVFTIRDKWILLIVKINYCLHITIKDEILWL